MGVSKSSSFTTAQNQIATLAKAMAHPARVAIIEHLLKVEGCICNDIVNELPLSQPTISQHLKELKTAGLIKGNISGKAICYCVHEAGIARLTSFFGEIKSQIQKNKSNCC